MDTGTGDSRQYIQINDPSTAVQQEPIEPPPCEKEEEKQKDEDTFWDRSKIKMLLTLCLENKLSNSTGPRDRTLWNNIAATLGTSPEECNKKYRNLRRTYIRLLKKKKMGRNIKWAHFSLCDEIYKEYKSLHPALIEPWEDIKIRRLLSLYIDNLHRFRNSDCLQKDIWKDIASQLGSTEYSCYHKFKNLKRTYMTWLERSRESGKLIKKWPYQHYFERIFYNYHPSLGPWDSFKTKQLLHVYAQHSHKFRNPKYQKKELWKEISTMVGESPNNCDRKFRNLKQTYIVIKSKLGTARRNTKWLYFDDFEAIYNSSACSGNSNEVDQPNSIAQEDYIKQLLQFYLDHKVKFKDPLTKKKNVWKMISTKLGLSPEECDRKFRNLKQTYNRLADRKKETGQDVKWPYYTYFEKIYNNSKSYLESKQSNTVDDGTVSEIRIVPEFQDRKDNDQKFERLLNLIEESNNIQRERNRILCALINQKPVQSDSQSIHLRDL